MDSIDIARLQNRVRLKYEWGRLRRACLGFAPALLVIALVACITPRPNSAMRFGSALFVLGVALLWYGRDLRRAVLPGVLAGAVPLTIALCANHVGHVCTGSACVSVCLPACTVGGLAAGIGVALFGYQGNRGPGYWLAGSSIALLTGAMGCACIGYSGVMGLVAGYTIGLVYGLSRKPRSS